MFVNICLKKYCPNNNGTIVVDLIIKLFQKNGQSPRVRPSLVVMKVKSQANFARFGK